MSKHKQARWDDDSVQFPRLIEAFEECGIPDACIEVVLETLDISYTELRELYTRASKAINKEQ